MKLNSAGVCPYIEKDNKIYLLVYKDNSDSVYNFFKGKIEENETSKECAIREFYEEYGIY